MVFFHAIFLLIALGITFGLNWLASIIPAHVLQEFSQFVVPVIAVVSTFFIASTDDVGHGKPSPKPRYLKRAILIGLICFGAWYYFSHLRYTSEVTSQLQEDYEDPKQELYAAYEEEFGVSGFWGYLLWSAKAGAHISIEDDDMEYADFDLPRGWSSFVVNWGYRVVNLYMVVLWVTKSYKYLKQKPPSRSAASPAPAPKTVSTSRTTHNAQAYLESGEAHRLQGDLDGAITDYTEAIRLDPTNKWPYNRRGYVRLAQGDHDGAIADSTEAIRLDPADAIVYTNRGTARLKQGDHEGAIADFEKALRLNPNDMTAYFSREVALKAMGGLSVKD